MTLANCESTEAKYGIPILETSTAQVTPEHHWAFELDKLPVPQRQEAFGMPWETTDNTKFRRFRDKLPKDVTPDSIYTNVVLPVLSKPSPGSQKTAEWFEARAFAVTASSFGQTSENAESLLKSKTYPRSFGFTGNSFTEWGSMHETHAEEAFLKFLKANETGDFELAHPAHLRDNHRVFLGFSPDALLWTKGRTEVDLVEYKCPAGRRSGPGHPYSSDKLNVPARYMSQIQGSMHLLRALYPTVRCVRTWFVVWQAHQFHVTHVPYVEKYAKATIDLAESFYKKRFLPACADAIVAREKTMLHFETEEACFQFHEDKVSDASLFVSAAPPACQTSSSSSDTCLTSSPAKSAAASSAETEILGATEMALVTNCETALAHQEIQKASTSRATM